MIRIHGRLAHQLASPSRSASALIILGCCNFRRVGDLWLAADGFFQTRNASLSDLGGSGIEVVTLFFILNVELDSAAITLVHSSSVVLDPLVVIQNNVFPRRRKVVSPLPS